MLRLCVITKGRCHGQEQGVASSTYRRMVAKATAACQQKAFFIFWRRPPCIAMQSQRSIMTPLERSARRGPACLVAAVHPATACLMPCLSWPTLSLNWRFQQAESGVD